MKIVTLLARNGTDAYPASEQRVSEIFAEHMPEVDRQTVIIDNALPPSTVERLNDNETLLGGDNNFWEFSAWDKAIAWLGSEIWSYDLVHLATSAFHTLYLKYLHLFNVAMLSSVAARPVCLGHIDCYNDDVRILSFQSQHWIRTSFFFLPPTELKMLRTLVSARNPERLLGNGSDRPFSENSAVCERYREYVLSWLNGSEIGQGMAWHSRLELTEESWPLFRSKALAIFNEHLLSIRLRGQGTRLIDTTWLAGKLAADEPDSIDWSRRWSAQLAERREDKVLVHEPGSLTAHSCGHSHRHSTLLVGSRRTE